MTLDAVNPILGQDELEVVDALQSHERAGPTEQHPGAG